MASETPSTGDPSAPAAAAEQARLDDAMRRADDLLLDSLRADEGRWQRRRRAAMLIMGGLLMTAIVCALYFAITAAQKDAQVSRPATQPATQPATAADAQKAKAVSA